MTVRLKTILGVGLIELFLLLLLVTSSLHTLRASNERALSARALTSAHLFAAAAENAVLATDLASLQSLVREVHRERGVVFAQILGRNGRVLAAAGSEPATRPPDELTTHADIRVAGVRYGQVRLGFATDAIAQLVESTRDELFSIAAIEMGLVGLFSFGLGTYLTRRLRGLERATVQVAEGALGIQLPARGTDELDATIRAFNTMSAQLARSREEREHAHRELLALNRDLERRVRERTDRLEKANTELRHAALHDPLTQLPNRTLLRERLAEATQAADRRRAQVALLMWDLHRFKEVNDTVGHAGGDRVLQTIAQRTSAFLGDAGTAARMGGDEFAAVLARVSDEAHAERLANELREALVRTIEIDGTPLQPSTSIGIALYPAHGDTVEALLRRAAMAKQEAKHKGVGVERFHEGMERRREDFLRAKRHLHEAIDSDALELAYQPQVDLRSGALVGVEALVRLREASGNLLYPDEFIPLAEETGLVGPLTDKVLRLALTQCRRWRGEGLELQVAVNVSAVSLREEDFAARVRAALIETEAHPQWLELELTESALMTDPKRAVGVVDALHRLGVTISVDDFGTGYSSLAYLKDLRVRRIKVDKSFVMDMLSNPSDTTIVRTVVDLGHNLGLEVVAEGVEDQAAYRALQAMACDLAQGYYIARPMAASAVMPWVRARPDALAPRRTRAGTDA